MLQLQSCSTQLFGSACVRQWDAPFKSEPRQRPPLMQPVGLGAAAQQHMARAIYFTAFCSLHHELQENREALDPVLRHAREGTAGEGTQTVATDSAAKGDYRWRAQRFVIISSICIMIIQSVCRQRVF